MADWVKFFKTTYHGKEILATFNQDYDCHTLQQVTPTTMDRYDHLKSLLLTCERTRALVFLGREQIKAYCGGHDLYQSIWNENKKRPVKKYLTYWAEKVGGWHE